jgi:hypothetical protein
MLTIAGYIVLAGAVFTALGFLWKKVIKPLAKFITEADQMLPLLVALNETFKNNPTAFAVINEIAAQFRTDSGSSLRDAVDGLVVSAAKNETAAAVNKAASEQLKIGVEAQRLLDVEDRELLRNLMLQLDRLKTKVTAAAATGDRMEEHAGHVADDLAESRKRANATDSNEAGAAADAALSDGRG